jgi:4-amino-4-deoxy-L-arabinose transferase-like glycosyltransferase
VVHAVLAVMAFNPSPYIGGDNATYMSLAKSLAEYHRYLEVWDPAMRPHTQYPPIWPAFLALLWMMGLRGWIVMKVTVLLCSVVAVALSYLWMRRSTSAGIALGAGIVLAVSPGVLELSHWELSDQPAWVLTMLALWASTHLALQPPAEGEAPPRRQGMWLAVLVAGVVLGNFVRAAGLPLVVAALLWLGMRKQWRKLAVLAAVFFPLAFLWWLWGKVNGAPGYASFLLYLDPYRPALGTIGVVDFLQRIATDADRYATMHLPIVVAWDTRLAYVLGIPLSLLAVAGWARRLKRPGLAEVWVPLYVGLLLVWPATWSGERFLLPLYPLMLCYAGEVVRDVAKLLGVPALATAVPAVAAALLLLVAAPGIERVVQVGRECSAVYRAGETLPCMNDEYHDLLKVAEMTRDRLPPGSKVLSRKATFFYALSGYQGRTYPLSANADTFFAFARETGAEYVVFDNIRDLAPLYLHPILRAHRDDFCAMPGLALPNAGVLRIERGAPPRVGVPENSFRVCGSRVEGSEPQPGQPPGPQP